MNYKQLLTPRMAKAGICVAAILGLLYVVLVLGGRNVEAERAVRATEGIEETSEQAQDMTHTADAVSTLIEDTVADVSSSASSADTATVTGPRPGEWYVRRVEDLTNRWGPRYAAAIADIDTFESRFMTTRDRLDEYFEKQSEITATVNDHNLRAELENRDKEERVAYSRWIDDGSRLLSQARNMRADLDDMDAVIRKQQLTVNMLSEYNSVRSIPNSVNSLHVSLGDFRRQSDQLAQDLSSQVFSAGGR